MYLFLQGTPIGHAWQSWERCKALPSHGGVSDPATDAVDNEKRLTISQLLSLDDYIENDPKQWVLSKKLRVVAIILFYTFAVYAGSAIYIVSADSIIREYGLSTQAVLLGLSLYVLGYGFGPLLWSPLSEVVWIGRNPVYWMTASACLMCSIATARIHSVNGFFVFRFLQGFFGSPCLVNGSASLHDMFEGRNLSLQLSVWVAFAYAGPAIGPLMASYLVEELGWRISMWEIVGCGAIALISLLLLPETYAPKILYASKKQYGDYEVQKSTQEGADTSSMGVFPTLRNALIKPAQIMFQDPAIAYVNIYTSYLYGAYYTFFDGFPMTYTSTYNFSHSQIGLIFLPIIVGCGVAVLVYAIYIIYFTNQAHMGRPEARLTPALYTVWAPPIGLLIFGWTAEYSVHWIAGSTGIVMYAGGAFLSLQCVVMCIHDSYPQYAASLFAANNLSRSLLASGAVHFGLPLYANLGTGKACTVLAAVSVLGIAGMFVLYFRGSKMRAHSIFTG